MTKSPVRIFIVDDNLLNIEYIQKETPSYPNFKFMGSAISGEKCLTKIKNMPVDVILMDIHLPDGMNGFETAKKIKEGENPPIFIFITVDIDYSYVEQAVELKSSLLGKHIKASDLFEKIERIFYEKEIIINPNPEGKGIRNRNRDKNKLRQLLLENLTKRELIIIRQIALGMSSQEIANSLSFNKDLVDGVKRGVMNKLKRNGFERVNGPLLSTLITYSGLLGKLSDEFPFLK